MADLTTLSRLKRFLDISGTEFDTLLAELITAASDAIQSYCGRPFNSLSRSEFHDGGSDTLILRVRPVTEVTKIYSDPSRQWAAGSEISPTHYVVKREEGIVVYAYGAFAPGVRTVKIIYTAGYATIPEGVAKACVLVCASWFHRSREGAGRMGSPPRLAAYPEEIGPVAGELLHPYREIVG